MLPTIEQVRELAAIHDGMILPDHLDKSQPLRPYTNRQWVIIQFPEIVLASRFAHEATELGYGDYYAPGGWDIRRLLGSTMLFPAPEAKAQVEIRTQI